VGGEFCQHRKVPGGCSTIKALNGRRNCFNDARVGVWRTYIAGGVPGHVGLGVVLGHDGVLAEGPDCVTCKADVLVVIVPEGKEMAKKTAREEGEVREKKKRR